MEGPKVDVAHNQEAAQEAAHQAGALEHEAEDLHWEHFTYSRTYENHRH
jgi:hypothetical protein